MRNGGWCRHQPPLSRGRSACRRWQALFSLGGSGSSVRLAALAGSLSGPRLCIAALPVPLFGFLPEYFYPVRSRPVAPPEGRAPVWTAAWKVGAAWARARASRFFLRPSRLSRLRLRSFRTSAASASGLAAPLPPVAVGDGFRAFVRFRPAALGHIRKLSRAPESRKRIRLWIKCIMWIISARPKLPRPACPRAAPDTIS